MTTAASNAKMPVTQNRIGKLKNRINQMKNGGQKKELRKPGIQRDYDNEASYIPKYVTRKVSTKHKLQGIQPRQPLRSLQPNIRQTYQSRDFENETEPRLHVGDTLYSKQQQQQYAPYRQHQQYTGRDREDECTVTSEHSATYWQTRNERRDFCYDDEYQERKAVGIVPPCPIGESDIDLHSLGISIGELFPLSEPVRRHDSVGDWFKHDEYRDDVIQYIMEQDRRYTVKSLSFLHKGDIQANMRTILVDWLIQVQVHQDLLDETLHLTVALIDRYHSQHIISLPKYQLLGVGCLFVAAKYCERFPPLIVELVKLTENTYTAEQVLNIELKILAVLQFDMTFIDPHSIMERYLHVFGYHKDNMVRYLSMYIIDLSLVEHKCIVYRRTRLVMNIVCMAKMILDETAQYHLMPHCKQEILTTLALMIIHSETAEQTAAKVKYSNMSRYHGISHLSSITTSPIVTSLANEVKSPMEVKHHVRFV